MNSGDAHVCFCKSLQAFAGLRLGEGEVEHYSVGVLLCVCVLPLKPRNHLLGHAWSPPILLAVHGLTVGFGRSRASVEPGLPAQKSEGKRCRDSAESFTHLTSLHLSDSW